MTCAVDYFILPNVQNAYTIYYFKLFINFECRLCARLSEIKLNISPT